MEVIRYPLFSCKIMLLLRILKKFAASKKIGAALPALLAGIFCFFNLWLPFRSGAVDINFSRISFGSFLLAGLPNNNIAWMMPLFETTASLVINLGASPIILPVIMSLASYLLVFCAGCLLRGYWAGIASLVGAGVLEAAGTFRYDDEQSFYSFSLLLVLSLLLLKRRDNTLKNSLLCGLALGASMLVRMPLLLFPPAVVVFDWFYSRERSKAFILRSLALLAASYILLIPWGFLNYSISGRFSIIDDSRAASNLITGAMGSIYTMEGDSRKLAGLGVSDSALAFFVRETVKRPGIYAVNVLKRIWHIFLFSPLLFGLWLIAMAASRERGKFIIFGMPVYFIIIHSALSIDERYFYPMLYVLPPLIIGSFWPGRADQEASGCCIAAKKITAAAFWLFFIAVLAVEALILAYPYRSVRNVDNREYLTRMPERFPDDRVFQDMKCKLLWIEGYDARYYECLGSYNKKFKDKVGAYFLAAQASISPSGLPIPADRKMECLIIKMLREFELDDQAAAMASFRQAYAEYQARRNMLRGEPYQRDNELALLIRGNSDVFWDEHVYRFLLMLPPKNAAKTLSGLKKSIELSGRLKLSALEDVLSLGEAGEHMLRKLLVSDLSGPPSGGLFLFSWKEDAKGSKKLSDHAVEKIISGDFKAAERILLKAVALNPTNPEAFMNLCFVRLRQNRKEKALEACRSAAYSVNFNPENKRPDLEILAAEAAFESYELLNASGRKSEAEKMLRRTVENAPAAWPGIPRAKAALKNLNRSPDWLKKGLR